MKKILLFFIIICVSLLYLKNIGSNKSTITIDVGRQFQVYRDDIGIPHIFAKKQQDIYFGMGYAEAQDRLWALLIKKFVVQGRMSQIFGRQALKSDYFSRNFKFHDVGKMNAKLLDEQARKKAQSYCDGINYYAKNVKVLPIEFYIFWVQWQNFTIQDSLSLIAFSAFSLEFDWMYQIARQRLLETVGFDLAYQIMNFGSKTLFRQTTIMKEDQLKQLNQWTQYNASKQRQILQQNWAKKKTSLGSIHLPTFQYQGSGSNAWVIGPEHTFNGKPLLANDPHLGTFAPALFYVSQLGLLDQQNNVIIQSFGSSMSGVPGISLGLNKDSSWGSTASYVDNKDLFYQTVRIKDDLFQYLHQDQWKNFTIRQQIFKVRWQGQQKRTMYQNHRGPVLQDILDQLFYKYSYPLHSTYRINHTITLSAAIYTPDGTSLKGMMNIPFAKSYQQFVQSSDYINSPNVDSVFINSTGSYGYSSVGRIPLRQINQMSGFIKDGSTSKYQMKGFLENDQKPRVTNPKKGYLAMCNNKFAPDQYKYRSSLHQITTGRAYRLEKLITEKIAQGHKFTFQDMKKMQFDTRDQFLSQAFPLVLSKLQSLRYIWSNTKTQKYFKLLSQWDYFMQKDSIQTTLYHVWQRLIQNSFLLQSQLNQQQRQAIINHAFFENYLFRLFQKIHSNQLGQDQRKVCSNSQTRNFTNLHPCEASIAIAFRKITDQVQNIFKTEDISQYKWGTIHQATFKSIPFSDIPISFIKNIWQRQTPVGGNSRSLNVGILTHQNKGDNKQKYKSIAGPIFRFITDLQQTYWTFDLGNNANINSQFYDNFLGKDQYNKYTRQNPKVKVPDNWKLSTKGISI